jgi:hypothetical protein
VSEARSSIECRPDRTADLNGSNRDLFPVEMYDLEISLAQTRVAPQLIHGPRAVVIFHCTVDLGDRAELAPEEVDPVDTLTAGDLDLELGRWKAAIPERYAIDSSADSDNRSAKATTSSAR